MTFRDPILHELFDRWPAWETLVKPFIAPGEHPADIEPRAVFALAAECETARLVARMYGDGHGATIDEAGAILADLLAGAFAGNRPKFGAELGFGSRELAPDHARPMPPLAASHNPASRPVPTSPPGRGAPTVSTTARS